MICVRYLQCQLNIIINKYGTYTEKIPKSSTAKRLLRWVGEYRGPKGQVLMPVGAIIDGVGEYRGRRANT